MLGPIGDTHRVRSTVAAPDHEAAPLRIEQTRRVCAPAMCGHRGNLVLAWTGNDRRVNLLTLAEHLSHTTLTATYPDFEPCIAPGRRHRLGGIRNGVPSRVGHR